MLRAPAVRTAIRTAAALFASNASSSASAPKKSAALPKGKTPPPPRGSVPFYELEAEQIFDRLAGEVSMDVIAGMGLMLRKIWRRLYENIQVDMEGIKVAFLFRFVFLFFSIVRNI